MSSGSRKKNAAVVRRRNLVEGILAAGRESSAATVMLHTAIAERSGLTATDTKTIDTLFRLGPVTAGELAGYTGLATAGPIRAGFAQVLENYGDEQLETILDFMRRSSHRARELTAAITARSSPRGRKLPTRAPLRGARS